MFSKLPILDLQKIFLISFNLMLTVFHHSWKFEKQFSYSNSLEDKKIFRFEMAEETKAEYVARAKLSEQAERYDDMADYMRKVTESGIGKKPFLKSIQF